ncbi:MAG: HD domain-containing phosphohydrolase [Syntrophomonadaceae bacterium]
MPFTQIFFWGVPIIALVSYCLLMLFLAISHKDRYIRTFMLILAAMILWTASALLMKIQMPPGVLFWNRVMVVGTLLVPPLLYYFISVFTNSVNRISIGFWAMMSIGTITIDLLGLIITQAAVLTETILINGHEFRSVAFSYTMGPGAYFVYAIMFAMIVASLIKIRQSIRNGSISFERIAPVGAGLILIFTGSLLNVFPAIGKYPVDILACFINAVLMLIAIFKYRMLELRFMVAKGIVYFIAVLFITGTYIYVVFSANKYLGALDLSTSQYVTAFAALLIAVFFQPLYRGTRVFIDRMFYWSKYQQRQALQQFSVIISNNLNLQEIARELIEAVQLAVGPDEVYVFIRHEEGNYYYVLDSSSSKTTSALKISCQSPVVEWLARNKASLSREELRNILNAKSMQGEENRNISVLDVAVITPFVSRNDLIGMLMLTGKRSKSGYTLDDLDLLTYLGSSSAVAIDNARLYAQAQAQALIDNLTKLYNHRFFHKALSEQIDKAGSADLSLLVIDLDFFKLFNDMYGHFAGDSALEKVAAIIRTIVGEKGIICRYGGEEFTILLPAYDSKQAFELAESIRLEIQRSFVNNDDVIPSFLSASIGVCTYPHNAPSARELLKRADLAMYSAKSQGKNQSVIYTPHIESAANTPPQDAAKPNYMATIYALTAAIDAKDHYTFGHSQRMAEYATALAGALGMDKSHLAIIREAALLHDIGKIGIPEHILTKTDRLTEDEFATIKGHVEMSIAIIKHLPSFNHVIPAVIGHHERWDGNGYPRGLKGESIPLTARCLAIADAFDAMTSDRPYREALSVGEALQEIERNAGTQFDPLTAGLFIKLVGEGTIGLENSLSTDAY